jgi:hypothetical protein
MPLRKRSRILSPIRIIFISAEELSNKHLCLRKNITKDYKAGRVTEGILFFSTPSLVKFFVILDILKSGEQDQTTENSDIPIQVSTSIRKNNVLKRIHLRTEPS